MMTQARGPGRGPALATSDIDHASENIVRHIAIAVLYPTPQIKPVYGHSGLAPLSFRKVHEGQAVYAVDDDEEIDFETVLREDPVPIPRAARYTGASHFNLCPEDKTRFIYM